MTSATKCIGIWLDHANAYLTEFTNEPMVTHKLESAFTHQDKIASMAKSEYLSHNKEQHEQAAFYKEIGEVIAKFDRVLLFGPTDAKHELHNTLKSNHQLDKIKIEVLSAEKMNTHEQQRFVREHFAKN